MAPVIMETENPHHLQADGETDGVAQRSECWGNGFQSESEGLTTRGAEPGEDGVGVHSEAGRAWIETSSTFVLFMLSTDWMMVIHSRKGHLLSWVHQFKCWFLPETSSETHSARNNASSAFICTFLAQSSGHKINQHTPLTNLSILTPPWLSSLN